MVACFYNAGGEVDIGDILICGCVAKENPSEIVAIKFASAFAHPFHTDAGAKVFKAGEIQFATVVAFKWCLLPFGVNKAIVEEDHVPLKTKYKYWQNKLFL
jgi:hypothetical protein